MYFDCHSHIDDLGRYEGWTVGSMLAKMEKAGVARVVVSSLKGIQASDANGLKTGNETIRRVVEQHGQVLKGACSVNPKLLHASIAEIDRHVANGPFVMIGELCQYLQDWDCSEPGLVPIMRRAAELDVPVLLHSSTEQHVAEALESCSRFPEAKIILAHMGGMNWLDQNVPTLCENPRDNLWIDISGACAFFANHLERMIETLGAHKIIFGVDMPLVEPGPLVKRIVDLGLADNDLRAIACDNLEALVSGC